MRELCKGLKSILRFFTSGIRKPAVKKKRLSSVNVALFAVTIGNMRSVG